MASRGNSGSGNGPFTRSQANEGVPDSNLEDAFTSLGVGEDQGPTQSNNFMQDLLKGPHEIAGANAAPSDLIQLELLKLIQDQRRELNARISALEGGKPIRDTPFKLDIPRLSDRDDVDVYLRAFEHLMIAHDIHEDSWACHIAPRLTGKAREAYTSLPVESLNSYSELKRAILARYQLNAETYRQKFRNSTKENNKSYEEWGVRLKSFLERWLDTAGVKSGESPDFQELILIEQALEQIPKELGIWLREKQPKRLTELTKLADEYVSVRGIKHSGPSQSRYRFNQNASKSNQQPVVKQSAPDIKINSSVKGNANRACFICGNTAHLAYQCPQRVNKDNSSQWSGYNKKQALLCNKAINRYECEGLINGREVVMLRDTGCDHTLVNCRLVDPKYYVKGKSITLLDVENEPIDFPIARVFLKCQYLTKWVNVGVSRNLQKDVLLGNELFDEPLGVFVVTRSKQKELESEVKADIEEVTLTGVKSKPIDEPHDVEKGEISNKIQDVVDGNDPSGSKLINDPENVKLLQRNEQNFKSLYERVVPYPDIDKHRVCFYLKDGLLMRKWQSKKSTGSQEYPQLVVPHKHRDSILRLAHDVPMGGHLGSKKTRDRILNNFYWPGIFGDVGKYCQSCANCQKTAGHRDVTKAPLNPLPIIQVPFKRIGMDLAGPLPRTKKGNRYVLVVVDYATRYPEAIPIPNQEAETIAEELVKLFSRVGIPEEIVSDQGTNFTSKLMKEVCNLLEIDHLKSSPYHPQTNGLVERFNGTLKSMLRAFVTQQPESLDRYIPYLLFAYREVPQSSTGFSPFELLYGRKVKGPLDVLKEEICNPEGQCRNENILEYVLDMRNRMRELTAMVQENLAAAQNQQKEWYDRTARRRCYGVGQQVLVFLPTASGKLQAEWQGPYPITNKISDTDYEIDTGTKRKQFRIFHVNMLRPWVERHCLYAQVLESDSNSDGNSEIGYQPIRTQDWQSVNISERLTEKKRNNVAKLLQRFNDILSDVPGRTQSTEHDVYVTNEVPITQKAYRLPQAKRAEIKSQLEQMLEAGIIKPSSSPWASPIVSVPKKDGSIRICTDYRKLNQVTKFDAYPIPRVDDIIDDVSGSPFISTLDLTKGYYQVPLSHTAREKSAFITPFGLFEYLVMPFGMRNAPATFQRLVDNVLQGCEEFAMAYIDDIVIFSKTWKEHLCHLEAVFNRLEKSGLAVKPDKCRIGEPTVPYLGYVIGSGEVRPEECKVEAIINWPTPLTKTDVRSFLGLTGYYRKLIPDFSQIASPLTDLTKKSKPTVIEWTEGCEQAFLSLKKLITCKPVLKSPDFEKDFILQCDASERGIGSVLSQIGEDGSEHPIIYISRKLSRSEEVYSTIEKECLAIVWAVQKLYVYLFGRNFLIQTDHKPLVWLDQMKLHNKRLTR
ncbi:uncharacterized protein [Apostichopus japonicus]|uniref:uncharacterized protein n=1 Tax=Stichopus japonicus TaxID=307972 RepID=UPI003AB29F89